VSDEGSTKLGTIGNSPSFPPPFSTERDFFISGSLMRQLEKFSQNLMRTSVKKLLLRLAIAVLVSE